VMTFTLNGVAVGLGVLYPNLKEANPNKIVSGFGGTLCLVLSSLYIFGAMPLLIVSLLARHSHPDWMIESAAAFALISLLIGWLPMKLGLSRLKNFEA